MGLSEMYPAVAECAMLMTESGGMRFRSREVLEDALSRTVNKFNTPALEKANAQLAQFDKVSLEIAATGDEDLGLPEFAPTPDVNELLDYVYDPR